MKVIIDGDQKKTGDLQSKKTKMVIFGYKTYGTGRYSIHRYNGAVL